MLCLAQGKERNGRLKPLNAIVNNSQEQITSLAGFAGDSDARLNLLKYPLLPPTRFIRLFSFYPSTVSAITLIDMLQITYALVDIHRNGVHKCDSYSLRLWLVDGSVKLKPRLILRIFLTMYCYYEFLITWS